MLDASPQNVLNATATVRPKRVAFMIDPATVSAENVDELTQACSAFWGGGYWPIVPTSGSDIEEDWWSLLEAVDPDVIYSICQLSDSLREEVYRRLAPAELVEARRPDEGRRRAGFAADLTRVHGLDALHVAPYHAKQNAYKPDLRFLYLKDAHRSTTDRSFVVRNFGLLSDTVGNNLAFDEVEHEELLISETTKIELLQQFADFHGEYVTPRDLGRLHAPRPFGPDFNRYAQAFMLVIGDTVEDLLLAWNRPLMSDDQAGRDVLWLDRESANDREFLELVARWVRRVFWDQQRRRGLVVSYSEELDVLNETAAILSEVGWLPCEGVRLTAGRFPLMARDDLGVLRYSSLVQDPSGLTERIPMRDGEGLLRVPRPPFPVPPLKGQGWMLDLDLEYHLDPPRYANSFDTWRLPRRAALGSLFSKRRLHARIVRGGLPSVSADSTERSIQIIQPTKPAVLWSLLQPITTRSSAEPEDRSERGYTHFQTSEQGRRFRGLVNLFGGVWGAGRFFENQFWRTAFLEAAAKPADSVAERAAKVLDVLREAAPETSEDTSVGTEAVLAAVDQSLAETIATALYRMEPRPKTFTIDRLRSLYGQLPREETVPTERGVRPLKFKDEAEHDMTWLLDDGVLLQGATLTCAFCGIKRWRIVDELASRMRCPECTNDFSLPVEPIWEFQLNGLVRSGLLQDGVLPLLHAVYDLTDRARHMALVMAPQDFFVDYEGPVQTDLDVIVVCDGRFVIGEVKSHPSRIQAKQLAALSQIARTVRPDEVVIAAVGSNWPEPVPELLEEMESELRQLGIQVTAKLMKW